MGVVVSIQETTVTPAGDGLDVQMYVSDKAAADALSAGLALTLRVRIYRKGTGRFAALQRLALEEMVDALKPLLRRLHEQANED
jgi:hypothetical protein